MTRALVNTLKASLEHRATEISEAGAGLHPVSKVREAVRAEALKHLREVAGQAQHYSGTEMES